MANVKTEGILHEIKTGPPKPSKNDFLNYVLHMLKQSREQETMNKPEKAQAIPSNAKPAGGLAAAIRSMSGKGGVPRVGDDLEIDWTRIDTGVEFDGKKIILPGDPAEMPYDVAIDTLARVRDSEMQTYEVFEKVGGLPWDAVVCLYKAMQQIYGVVLPETVRGWFFNQEPSFLTVRTGHRDTDLIQVPMGQMRLPNMKAPIQLGIHRDYGYIHGTVYKSDRARMVEIAKLAREIMREGSIYKGKAISLKVNDKGEIAVDEQPEFFDVSNVTENDMIHNKVTTDLIESSIFGPIKHREACLRHGIPLKRGILLEGKYGTGKTLTARVTASVAAAHGWTFVVIDKPSGLSAALTTASLYQPAIVFAEDIDRFGDRGKDSVNKLVNLIDGLIPANSAVMTVLTTNFIELIDKSLLRPGRFDAVISIDAPDAHTVTRLVKHYGGTALGTDVDIVGVGEILAGQIPATVAEVVKRAKLMMLTENRDELTAHDLETAAHGMARHLRLLDDTPPAKSAGDQLYGLLRKAVEPDDKLKDLMVAVHTYIND